MIPVRIGLGKVFCREQLFWQPTGHSSFAAVLQGNLTFTDNFKRFYLLEIALTANGRLTGKEHVYNISRPHLMVLLNRA